MMTSQVPVPQNTSVEPESASRFACTLCESTFARKEHLTRHLKTHDPATSHVCSICGKKFNRSDSLLRHLNRHGENLTASSNRSKQACVACHASKIKCDGNQQCQACLKKGIECVYRPQDGELPPNENEEQSTQIYASYPASSSSTNGTPKEASLDKTANGHSGGRPHSDWQKHNTLPSLTDGFVKWSGLRLQKDPQELASVTKQSYLDYYFTHFHPRFPFIHRPSYDDQNKGPVLQSLLSSIAAMGAWLEGTEQSRQYAIQTHNESSNQCLLEISNISSTDEFQKTLPAGLCQAILVNVIFALYSGKEKLVSRGVMLHTLLVSALREVGFFNPNNIWPDEKPGTYLPWHLLKSGERQSLTLHLFKIDAHLSMLRGQARLLTTEDLIFQTPASFSLFNANGLQIWESRASGQSPFRSRKRMSEMITSTTELTDISESDFLIEDLHLSLCATQAGIRNLHSQIRIHGSSTGQIEPMRAELKRKLDIIKFRMAEGIKEPFGDCLMRHYFGYEDHTIPGWQPIIEARVQGLYFDLLILHRLLYLHLYIEPARMLQVAKEFVIDMALYSSEQQGTIGKRRCDTASWVSSPDARRALCAAVDILTEFNSNHCKPGADYSRVDPTGYIALSTAALVLWNHCTFGMYSCNTCAEALGGMATDVDDIELGPIDYQLHSREDWIEKSLVLHVKIYGLYLCHCNLVTLIEKFDHYIPEGWELKEALAPGIFGMGMISKILAESRAAEKHT